MMTEARYGPTPDKRSHDDRLAGYGTAPVELSHDRLARHGTAPVELSHDRLARHGSAPVELSHYDTLA